MTPEISTHSLYTASYLLDTKKPGKVPLERRIFRRERYHGFIFILAGTRSVNKPVIYFQLIHYIYALVFLPL